MSLHNLKELKWKLSVFVLLAIIYFVVFRSLAEMKETAFFGGDEWEYQSMAVNFAKGHGIQKFGCMEPFEVYRFEKQDPLPDYYPYFVAAAGQDRFYRTPVYPFFLGVVYRIFGINPQIAKSIQLLLLVIVAAALPFIGLHYYEKIGFLAGIPSGILFLINNYPHSINLLTESLISFVLFAVVLSMIAYEHRAGILTAITLGIILGLAVLTKGSLMFIPFLLFFTVFIRAVIRKNNTELKLLTVIILSSLCTILPWSAYATVRSGELILLSTQGNAVLLEMNNEFCTDGGWHPEYSKNKDSFYNNDGIDNSRTLLKVANFYWKNPNLFFQIMSNKAIKGFYWFNYFWLFIFLAFLKEILNLGQKWLKTESSLVLLNSIILASGFLIAYYIANIVSAFLHLRISLLMPVLIGIFAWLTYRIGSGKLFINIPLSFKVIWGNFLITTLMSGAMARYIEPMNFIFILIFCVAALRIFIDIWTRLNVQPLRNKIES